MNSLLNVLQSQRSTSFRETAGYYSTRTLRKLIDADSSKSEYFYLGYQVQRTDKSISVANKDGELTQFTIQDNAPITKEQEKQILDIAWEKFKEIFEQNKEGVLEGKVNAADIGAMLFGGLATGVLFVLKPFGAGGIAHVLGSGFVALAANKGRYFGAAVDEVIAILKGESELKRREIIGVFATIAVTATYFAGTASLIPLGGKTAWDLTLGVGKWVGGALEDIIDELRNVPIAGQVVEAVEEVVQFIGKIF